jgi:hypothetical protein
MSSCQHSPPRSPASWFLYAGSRFHLHDVNGELLQKLVLDATENPRVIMMYLSSHELTVFQVTEFTPDGKPRQQDAIGPPCHHVEVEMAWQQGEQVLPVPIPAEAAIQPGGSTGICQERQPMRHGDQGG